MISKEEFFIWAEKIEDALKKQNLLKKKAEEESKREQRIIEQFSKKMGINLFKEDTLLWYLQMNGSSMYIYDEAADKIFEINSLNDIYDYYKFLGDRNEDLSRKTSF